MSLKILEIRYLQSFLARDDLSHSFVPTSLPSLRPATRPSLCPSSVPSLALPHAPPPRSHVRTQPDCKCHVPYSWP